MRDLQEKDIGPDEGIAQDTEPEEDMEAEADIEPVEGIAQGIEQVQGMG